MGDAEISRRETYSDAQALLAIKNTSDLQALATAVVLNARRLSLADGACFIIRDGDYCHYIREDAISSLWAGQRFPIRRCVSGYSILNSQPVVIPDITEDFRVPQELYLRTFVRSLVIVPVVHRNGAGDIGIAAIGCYWAEQGRDFSNDEVQVLQALAEATDDALKRLGLSQSAPRSLQAEASGQVVAHEVQRLAVEVATGKINIEHCEEKIDLLDERMTINDTRLGERIDDLKGDIGEVKLTVKEGLAGIGVKLRTMEEVREPLVARFIEVEKTVGTMKAKREKLRTAIGSIILLAIGAAATQLVEFLAGLLKKPGSP